MCSILFTSKDINDFNITNKKLKYRGPDYTGTEKINGYTFIHNLLSITGDFTKQPFIEDDIVCMFNGQIYNYLEFGDYTSDGLCLIPLYKEFGKNFIKKLDGEFIILLADFNKRELILSTDIIGTKPMWIGESSENFGVSTYSSPLDELGYEKITKVDGNTTLIYDLDNFDLKEKISVYDFDLSQYKDSFVDWNDAFEKSISKRINGIREHLFMGLSSGYDSGTIASELLKQNVSFKSYTIIGMEDIDIIDSRYNIINKVVEHDIINITLEDEKFLKKYIVDRVEEFQYRIYNTEGDFIDDQNLYDDTGAMGLAFICRKAKKENRKIYLSGSGADEIFSDYGFNGVKKFPHSNFGGLFPKDLSTIFPWPSFYKSSQESYLIKEEYVAGSFGLETRYPFLDKDVIQEFMWLDMDLKNSNYKSVLHNYLLENDFPFLKDKKIGFAWSL